MSSPLLNVLHRASIKRDSDPLKVNDSGCKHSCIMAEETYCRPFGDDPLLLTSLKHHSERFVTQGGIHVLRAAFTFVAAIRQFRKDRRIRFEFRLSNSLGPVLLFCVIPFHR